MTKELAQLLEKIGALIRANNEEENGISILFYITQGESEGKLGSVEGISGNADDIIQSISERCANDKESIIAQIINIVSKHSYEIVDDKPVMQILKSKGDA